MRLRVGLDSLDNCLNRLSPHMIARMLDDESELHDGAVALFGVGRNV